ncbi:expansin EXLX1 family cellulose-binding protein [Archangium sp.]|uniref:expansin EXLX1 family cellulose-binding protein n=1 Tax=Archangium sp. TaxID=1872627 RepID=UPI002D663CB9|nr:expansin EXLX1 family cellulose-binding protein [Archangium sp.]HYO54724.1 expansin EXLX1 family cellulose-binding protein [Archangium sp.]
MRIEKPVPARWLAAVLFPLLTACGPTDPGEALRALGEFQDGLITFYDADGSGNCSFEPSPQNLDVAAMNIGQYQGSAVCGTCVEIEGPKGNLRVRIVDSCPDCPTKGHLDLSREAFAKIANPIDGRVKVRWRMVTCDVQGPIRYHFKDGSSQWWTAIQVLNHRMPVTKLEYWKNGAWVNVKRESYNYFEEPNGMGSGSIKVRVTASDGQTLEDTLPGAASNKTYDGAAQFKAG